MSCRESKYKEGFVAGMTMTDEPGFYDEKRGFGVRIENTMHILVARGGGLNGSERGGADGGDLQQQEVPDLQAALLRADPGDLCVSAMMDEKEKKWLREYNHKCYEQMLPRIKDERVLAWVKEQAEKAALLYGCL